MQIVTYGPGGHNPAQPNDNVVETVDVTVPPEQVNQDQLRAQVAAHLADLRTIRDSTGTLTGAQLSNAVRELARGQIQVIRLLLANFDATD